MNEDRSIGAALSKARAFSLPATLTKEAWARTVADFEARCAYCDLSQWQVVEHFVPISLGGGTTPGNCLPACAPCNYSKSSKPIEQLEAVFGVERLSQLRTYLAGRSVGIDVGVLCNVSGHTQTAFRLPDELLEGIDALVEQINETRPWPKMTRSDFVRLVLAKAVEDRPEWLVGDAKPPEHIRTIADPPKPRAHKPDLGGK
jgi:hypothetical protein